jgi:ComF family protein
LDKEEAEYCYDCSRKSFHFTAGLAVFPYDRYMKRSIEYFKFHNRREYAEWYADEMTARLGQKIRSWRPDCLVPVPIHRSRLLERGYNQTELVAKEVGKRLGIYVEPGLLERCKKTVPQKTLNDRERIKNLKNAFQIRKSVVQYKRVVLVDDIYTTGSTIEACTQVLLESGVEQVYFVCICIGYGL